MRKTMCGAVALAALFVLSGISSGKEAGDQTDNVLGEYVKYDFSTLFVPRTQFLGYIGGDCRRLHICLTSISKSLEDDRLYLAAGVSFVGKNKCQFKGTIRVQQIRKYADINYGCDEEYKQAGIKAEGELIGEYTFKEIRGQTHSGVFEGSMCLLWVVDRNGILQSDHIDECCSDAYCNNQYEGTWKEYGKDKAIVANWGELRIPCADRAGLDIGAGHFSPHPKYRDKGWANLELDLP